MSCTVPDEDDTISWRWMEQSRRRIERPGDRLIRLSGVIPYHSIREESEGAISDEYGTTYNVVAPRRPYPSTDRNVPHDVPVSDPFSTPHVRTHYLHRGHDEERGAPPIGHRRHDEERGSPAIGFAETQMDRPKWIGRYLDSLS